MRSVAFITSRKENENRRALLPEDVKSISNRAMLFFEKGYGSPLGIEDDEYEALGCHICTRSELLNKDVLVDPKIGDADYLDTLQPGQIMFGWVHATQNYDVTERVVRAKATAYGWEKMFEGGRHSYWRNNEIAGEAAIMDAFQHYARMPYGCKVAVLGRGNIARGALKILTMLGADVRQYDRKTEALFVEEIGNFDVIVNAVLWDVARNDHIIHRSDLMRMKRGAMIVDVSCDRAGAIETSVPTTIERPTYVVEGITHYVVDHTPALFYKTATASISRETARHIDHFVTGAEKSSKILLPALLIEDGKVVDQEIISYQDR